MNKVKEILIITVFSIILLPMLTQATSQVTRNIPLGLNSLENMRPNGEFEVYIFRNTHWQKVGDLAFDKFFRERKIDLSSYISGSETVKIRLLQSGGGAAHIDSVFLGEMPPSGVKGIENSFSLKKLSQKDFDVIDAYGRNIEVMFSAEGKDKTLNITARVESQKISDMPFQFPLRNLFRGMDERSEFYTYSIGPINESANLFFKEYSRTGSGHPSGFTYGWVSNDDKNLYVKIDFTPDNTMDGEKDYAKVYVKTEKGLKEFKVSVPEKKWGNPDFTYTDKVAYQHKVYDFKIPFTELGIQNMKDGENLLLAFAAYGTANPGDYSSDLAYDSANNRYLAVFVRVGAEYDIYGQLLNCDGTPYGAEFLIYESGGFTPERGVRVAYDSGNKRFLLVWAYGSVIYGQLVNANGTLNGGPITISSATAGYQQSPTVAYDNVNNQYLVAWEDSRSGTSDIYGQFIDAGGTLDGDNFFISNYADQQHSPAVAFNSTNEMFLVVWDDSRSGVPNPRDIYGQLVDADAQSLEGSNFLICDAANMQWSTNVSNDSTNDRFLVVWYDDRDNGGNGDIYGRLVNADDGSLAFSEITISGASNSQVSPEAVYDSVNNQFLAVWRDARISTVYPDIYGQYIDADDGSRDGNNFSVARTSDISYSSPQIGYNLNSDNFLILSGTHEGSIYDFALTLIGPPCEETDFYVIPNTSGGGAVICL